jgi:hypothetical protein
VSCVQPKTREEVGRWKLTMNTAHLRPLPPDQLSVVCERLLRFKMAIPGHLGGFYGVTWAHTLEM